MRWSYVFAEFARRPGRTLTGVLSVALGVALFISLQAYGAGYREAARAPLAGIGADIIAQREGIRPEAFEGIVFPHSTAPLHRDEINEVRALPGVEAVGEAMFFWSFESDQFLVGLGVDPSQSVGPGRLRAGVQDGRFLEAGDHGVVVLDASYAAQHTLELGDEVTVGGEPMAVVGLVDTTRAGQVASANVYLPLSDARRLVAEAVSVRAVHDVRVDDANVLFVRADPVRGPELAEEIGAVLGDDALVTTPRSFDQVLGTTFSLIDQFGMLVGVTALLVTAVGLLRSAAATLSERRRDVALMRAVGWRRRDVAAQLVAEVLAMTGMGALLGIILAGGIAWLLGFTTVTIPIPWELSPTPHFLPGGAQELALSVPLPATVRPAVASEALALTLAGAGAVGLWLARRSAAIKPAEVWANA
ncbi:MAG: ABC transporter permease [Egibacteraceae bacterium]